MQRPSFSPSITYCISYSPGLRKALQSLFLPPPSKENSTKIIQGPGFPLSIPDLPVYFQCQFKLFLHFLHLVEITVKSTHITESSPLSFTISNSPAHSQSQL